VGGEQEGRDGERQEGEAPRGPARAREGLIDGEAGEQEGEGLDAVDPGELGALTAKARARSQRADPGRGRPGLAPEPGEEQRRRGRHERSEDRRAASSVSPKARRDCAISQVWARARV
jgi:hypothetical protein